MSSRTALTSLPMVPGKNQGEVFLLSKLQKEGKEGIKLTLSDGEQVWLGELSESDLDELASRAKMDFTTYVDQTVAAFTGLGGEGGLSFQFQTRVTHDESLLLIWKKQVPGDDIKFQLGSVVLKKRSTARQGLVEMFSHAIHTTQQLQQQIRSLETDNQRLSQERAMALKRLDKCVTAKEDIEKDLYFKFMNVLNSKKEKIRSLRRELEERASGTLASGGGTHTGAQEEEEESEPEVPPKKQAKKSSQSADDSEENTDDEPVTPSKRHRKAAVPIPSLSAEDSLVLEDKDEPTTSRVVRRPARQRATKRQTTPAKPVLPRVSSASKTPESSVSSARKTSLRKSGSNNSDRSASGSAVDAEDLFNDL